MIEPELELSHEERAHLAALHSTRGYKILVRLMRAEADKFIVALLNADAANASDVTAKHKIAKAAAQFMQATVDRVNGEVSLYTMAPKKSDKPLDVTEGIMDFGDLAEQVDHMPNLLVGGEEFE